MLQHFLNDFATTHAQSLNILLLDNARSHTATTLVIPANVVLLFQEPYAPELNPCERVWQAFKSAIAWNCFATVDELRQHMVMMLKNFSTEMLASLTSYSYIMEAINALSS